MGKAHSVDDKNGKFVTLSRNISDGALATTLEIQFEFHDEQKVPYNAFPFRSWSGRNN